MISIFLKRSLTFCFKVLFLSLFISNVFAVTFSTGTVFTENKWGTDAGDIDGDGDKDLVLCDQNGELIWQRNDNGTWQDFTIQANSTSGWQSWTCHLVDVDQDGKLDIVGGKREVIAGLNQYQVGWYRNLGNNNWQYNQVSDFSWSNAIYWVESGDIDNDGDIDIAVANYDTLEWFENKSSGWVEKELDTSLMGAHCAHLADFDNDGDLEILGCSYYMNQIKIYEHSGALVFTDYPLTGAWSAEAFDIDGDNDQDFAITGMGGVSLYQNNSGSFTNVFSNNAGGYSVKAGDIDNDGDLDFIVGGQSGLALFKNTGSVNSWSKSQIGMSLYVTSSVIADFNGDNQLDIGMASDSYDFVQTLLQN